MTIGGVQKSLVEFLKILNYRKYSVDLMLLDVKGPLLKEIPQNVNIIPAPKALKAILFNKKDIKEFIFSKELIEFPTKNFIQEMILGKLLNKRKESRRTFWDNNLDFFKKNLKQQNYDICISYSGELFDLYCSNFVNSKKKYSWFHGDYGRDKINWNSDYEKYKAFDKIIFVSQSSLNLFRKEFPEFQDKSMLINNLIDIETIKKKSEMLVGEDFKDKKTNILTVTRLDKGKGLMLGLEAISKVNKDIDFQWFVLGGGTEHEVLKKKIKKMGLENKVILKGFINNPYPYFKNCDIYFHPSFSEGKSISVEEALIFGMPVLLTNYPTAKDHLSKKNDIEICDFNSDSIAEVINKLSKRDKLKENEKNIDFLYQREDKNKLEKLLEV